MTTTNTKPSVSFWVIAIIALIWNLMGASAYIFQAFITDEQIAALPEEQKASFLIEYPAWYTALFALAVFVGVLACIFLLLKKKTAYHLFLISGICAIIQQGYLLTTIALPSVIMPVMIIVISLFLIWYSKKCAQDGILN
ncbi:hypothetical protein [Polaribacter sp.]|uniref:hypothetical protein n=1 Tax=Polaribacter sp. TaxID=1920175 RepID=UPI003F6CBAE5